MTYDNLLDKLDGDAVNDVTPIYIVLGHEGVKHILLTPEHTVEDRLLIMRKSLDGKKRHEEEQLKDLNVGQPAVDAFVSSKRFIVHRQ